MRVVGEVQVEGRDFVGDATVDVEVNAEDVRLLAAVDGEHAVRRDLAHRLLEAGVRVELLALPLGERLDLVRGDEADIPDEVAQGSAHVRAVGHHLGEDFLHAAEHVVHVEQPLVRIDEAGQHFVELRNGGVAVPDGLGQRCQTLLAGLGRLRFLLRLVRQVEVFEPFGEVRGQYCLREFVREFALEGNALEDRLLAVGEVPELLHAFLDAANHVFVQAAGPFLPIPRDEGNRVLVVEQHHDGFDLRFANLQVLGHAAEVVRLRRGRHDWHRLSGHRRHHGRERRNLGHHFRHDFHNRRGFRGRSVRNWSGHFRRGFSRDRMRENGLGRRFGRVHRGRPWVTARAGSGARPESGINAHRGGGTRHCGLLPELS